MKVAESQRNPTLSLVLQICLINQDSHWKVARSNPAFDLSRSLTRLSSQSAGVVQCLLRCTHHTLAFQTLVIHLLSSSFMCLGPEVYCVIRMCPRLSQFNTVYILLKYAFLSLLSNPTQLISKLYFNQCIENCALHTESRVS